MLNILEPYRSQLKDAQQMAYINHCIQQMRARSEQYRIFREYYDGDHDTQLTDRMKAFLQIKIGSDPDFSVNYCPMVVTAKSSRLNVIGFKTEDDTSEILWDIWQKNRMDALQGIVHLAVVRDADTFVLCEWDNVAKIPRYYHEKAYCGAGVMVYYSDERQTEIKFASKQWIINYGEKTGKQRRLNLYFPNRIERYLSDDDVSEAWMPYVPDDDPTVFVERGAYGMAGISWWTRDGTENGEPLGIPIFHFKDNDSGDCYGNGILNRVIPLQNALNKAEIDLIAAMDVEGFGLMVGTGADWSGAQVGPGAIVSTQKSKSDASLERLAGTNPVGMLAVKNDIIMDIARVTGTPLSYLQSSGQVAAEGTLKQQESPLIAQIKKAQVDFGNVWEDCMNMGRKLINTFGNANLDESVLIETVWAGAETRNEAEETATLVQQVEKLGVTQEKAQEKLGYNAEEREAFAREKMQAQADAMRLQTRMNAQTQAQAIPDNTAQNNTQTANEAQNGNAPPL